MGKAEFICKDTILCRWLNKENCGNCVLEKMRDRDKQSVLEDFDVTVSNLPNDINDIFGEKCQFCIDNPKERDCYASISIVHPEPYSESAFMGIGPKVKRKIGSILRLDISCCGECKNIFKQYAFRKRMTAIISAAAYILSMAVLFATGIVKQNIFEWATALLIIFALLGIVASAVVSKTYIKKYENRVRGSVFHIPIVEKLLQMGWSTLEDNTECSYKLRLSKDRTNSFGRFTGKTNYENEPGGENAGLTT